MILITGSSGRVGSATVKSLLEQGKSVREGIHLQQLDIDGVETCHINFDQPEILPPALEGIDPKLIARVTRSGGLLLFKEQSIVHP